MTERNLRNFARLSGWQTPESFGHDNDGYVTVEESPKTRKHEAFFWGAEMNHEHLQTMWMDGHYFVRRFTT